MYTEHTRRCLPMLSLGKVQRMRNANTPCRAHLRSGRGKFLYDRRSHGSSPPESSRYRIPRRLTFHILVQSPPGLSAGMLRTGSESLLASLKCTPMSPGRRPLAHKGYKTTFQLSRCTFNNDASPEYIPYPHT